MKRRRFTLACWGLVIAIAVACHTDRGGRVDASAPSPPTEAETILPTGLGETVDRDIARARAATAPFKDIERAVAAGYPARAPRCLANPPAGGMGYHHQNTALTDTLIEVERPEILVYGDGPDGRHELIGIEYVVPFDVWKHTDPPEVMGQRLKRAEALRIWYLHVWLWKPNSSGLFADWNPAVTCP